MSSSSVPNTASHPNRKVRARFADMIGGGTAYAGSKPTAEPECKCPNEFFAKNNPHPNCDVHGVRTASKPSVDSDKTPPPTMDKAPRRSSMTPPPTMTKPDPTMTKPDKAPLRDRIAGKIATKPKDEESAAK